MSKIEDPLACTGLHSEPLLYVCLPFIILGVFVNVFVIWIWSSVKQQAYHTMYLFKALAVSDLFISGLFIPAHFYIFPNFFCNLFIQTLCYGSRSVGVFLTLTLAVARLIRLLFPLHSSRLLSRDRMRFTVTVIIISCLTFQVFHTGHTIFVPREYSRYAKPGPKIIFLISVPAIAQNVVMAIVLWKVRQVSRKVAPILYTNLPRLPGNGLNIPERKHQTQQPSEEVTGFPEPQTAETPDPEPQTAETPDPGPQTAETPDPEPQTAETPDPEPQTAETPDPEPQTAETPDPEPQTAETPDPEPQTSETPNPEPQTSETPNPEPQTSETPNPEPETADQGREVFGPEPGPQKPSSLGQKRVSFNVDAQNRLGRDRLVTLDRQVAYVVIAICLTSFIAYPVVSLSHFIWPTEPFAVGARIILVLINSCVNVVYYMFISSFRAAVGQKREQFAHWAMPTFSTIPSHFIMLNSSTKTTVNDLSKTNTKNISNMEASFAHGDGSMLPGENASPDTKRFRNGRTK